MGPLASKSLLILLFLLLIMVQSSQSEKNIKSQVFLSPKIEVEPGQSSNKIYNNIDFPKGHIAVKSFHAEVVDDRGESVPLYEAYLHHWIVIRYDQEINNQSNMSFVPNSGVCNLDSGLIFYFGVGAETRRTLTRYPEPYGIEVGNPADIPQGFEEAWMMNVHVIDLRGAVDSRGCLECTCDLYSNITMPEPLPRGYLGGLRCCTDGARCGLKEGYQNSSRSLYLKYTIEYVEWDDDDASVVPVKVYLFDVTDSVTKGNESTGIRAQHNCQVEYDVEACPSGDKGCIDSRTFKMEFEDGGNVIYGVGHLHVGGTSIALYGEGGREICTSNTKYGNGSEPGNEAGYVVGMSTCYPRPGSVQISPGENLTLVSNYSSTVSHAGVMGLFYMLVAAASSA